MPDTNIPGIQYPVINHPDPQLREAVKNIYDNLFYIRRKLGEPSNLNPAQLRALEQRLISQVVNSVVNNITINASAIFLTGPHNLRLTTYGAASQPTGTAFFETDRNVVYIITDGPKKWEFGAGLMLGLFASRPTDLGTYDASFLFFSTDTTTLYVWDGATWQVAGGATHYPIVIDTVALTGQTTDLGPTLFTDSDNIGTYRVNWYLETTTADPLAGDVDITVAFADDVGPTTILSANLPLSVLGRTSGVAYIQVADSVASAPLVTRGFLFSRAALVTAGLLVPFTPTAAGIEYSTTITGVIGSARYSLYLTLERLS